MTIQYIHDKKGNTTGVFIPIDEWQTLKNKYMELQSAEIENGIDLAPWQQQILEERLTSYNTKPTDVEDFDKTILSIERTL